MTEASDVVDALREQAGDDDEALVRLAAQRLADDRRVRTAVEALRDGAALRLRRAGVPMTRIARAARVSDSYLTRRLLRLGARRRVSR